MSIAVVILAAGKGTRMQSDLPKVLHQVAGAPMLVHTMRAAQSIDAEQMIVVAGHGSEHVRKAAQNYAPNAEVVLQEEQLGTGHAVAQAKDALQDFSGDVFILYGDTPFITQDTLQKMIDARANGADIVVLGFHAAEPGGYGRLILNDNGDLTAIVEAKDATPEQLNVDFCNSGVICASSDFLFSLVAKLGNDNANGEYYLTDIVGLAQSAGQTCAAVSCDEAETMGVNSRVDLSHAEGVFQARERHRAMENGVTLLAPETVFFAYDTHIGRDVIVEQNVVFAPGVTVETGAHIRAFCHLEGCHVSKDAIIGPYARLRPGAEIGDGAKVGNFVEIKAAQLAQGAKVNHLSYVGDAEIGENANIGAGTITCNYDGVFKHKTTIGERAFIGSNTSLIAPVTVGDDAMTGSGSVISQDIPAGDLGLSRAKQENKAGFATRFMAKLKAAKAAKKGN